MLRRHTRAAVEQELMLLASTAEGRQ